MEIVDKFNFPYKKLKKYLINNEKIYTIIMKIKKYFFLVEIVFQMNYSAFSEYQEMLLCLESTLPSLLDFGVLIDGFASAKTQLANFEIST